MGVTIDHDVGIVPLRELRRCRTAHFVAVAHVEMYSAEFNIDPLGESWLARWIGIAEYRPHWRDQSQLVENLLAPDITRVKNELHSFQSFVNARSNDTVRIRDEPHNVRVGLWHSFYILEV